MRVALEGERQVRPVFERDDHVRGGEPVQATGAACNVGVHLVVSDEGVGDAGTILRSLTAVAALCAGVRTEAKGNGDDGKGSKDAFRPPDGLRSRDRQTN